MEQLVSVSCPRGKGSSWHLALWRDVKRTLLLWFVWKLYRRSLISQCRANVFHPSHVRPHCDIATTLFLQRQYTSGKLSYIANWERLLYVVWRLADKVSSGHPRVFDVDLLHYMTRFNCFNVLSCYIGTHSLKTWLYKTSDS